MDAGAAYGRLVRYLPPRHFQVVSARSATAAISAGEPCGSRPWLRGWESSFVVQVVFDLVADAAELSLMEIQRGGAGIVSERQLSRIVAGVGVGVARFILNEWLEAARRTFTTQTLHSSQRVACGRSRIFLASALLPHLHGSLRDYSVAGSAALDRCTHPPRDVIWNTGTRPRTPLSWKQKAPSIGPSPQS